MDPPTCWAVLRVADPTPASWGANPRVPVLKEGATLSPNPTPNTRRYGSTWLTYDEWSPTRWSPNIAAADTSNPIGTIGLGPNIGKRIRLDTWAVAANAATRGRNATPVFTGLNPNVPCR